MSSQDSWLQLYSGVKSSKRGITPCSCSKYGGGSGAVTCRMDVQTALEEAMEESPALDACELRRGNNMEVWITVFPSTVNGMDLEYQGWFDSLFIRYGIEPPGLLPHCDGCNAKFSICRYLDCKKGGLVTACPNAIFDRVADLTGKSFASSYVRDDPLIHPGSSVWEENSQPAGYPNNNSPGSK